MIIFSSARMEDIVNKNCQAKKKKKEKEKEKRKEKGDRHSHHMLKQIPDVENRNCIQRKRMRLTLTPDAQAYRSKKGDRHSKAPFGRAPVSSSLSDASTVYILFIRDLFLSPLSSLRANGSRGMQFFGLLLLQALAHSNNNARAEIRAATMW